jgi:hypothetical protein
MTAYWRLGAALAVAALAGAGCAGGGATGARGYEIGAGYWGIDIKTAEAKFSGGDNVNLLGTMKVESKDDTYFASFAFSKGPDVYGLSYATVASEGQATLTADTTFGGTLFANGTTVKTSMYTDFYEFSMGGRAPEPQSVTTYSIAVRYIDLDVNMHDVATPATKADWKDNAWMLLLGVAYDWAAGSGTTYFVDAKWMDLDWVRIGHTGGQVIDVYGGIKWSIGGQNANLAAGYRYVDTDLDISGNKLKVSYEGPVVGFTAKF